MRSVAPVLVRPPGPWDSKFLVFAEFRQDLHLADDKNSVVVSRGLPISESTYFFPLITFGVYWISRTIAPRFSVPSLTTEEYSSRGILVQTRIWLLLQEMAHTLRNHALDKVLHVAEDHPVPLGAIPLCFQRLDLYSLDDRFSDRFSALVKYGPESLSAQFQMISME